jgi:hypothetical protein
MATETAKEMASANTEAKTIEEATYQVRKDFSARRNQCYSRPQSLKMNTELKKKKTVMKVLELTLTKLRKQMFTVSKSWRG